MQVWSCSSAPTRVCRSDCAPTEKMLLYLHNISSQRTKTHNVKSETLPTELFLPPPSFSQQCNKVGRSTHHSSSGSAWRNTGWGNIWLGNSVTHYKERRLRGQNFSVISSQTEKWFSENKQKLSKINFACFIFSIYFRKLVSRCTSVTQLQVISHSV